MSKPTIEDMQAALIHIQKEKIDKLNGSIDKIGFDLGVTIEQRNRCREALEEVVNVMVPQNAIERMTFSKAEKALESVE